MIAMKQITYNVLTSDEFDELVRTHIGREDFKSIPQYEWNNDSCYVVNDVRKEPNYGRYREGTPREQVEEWFVEEIKEVEASATFSHHYALQWLCYKGHIEPGNYLIKVSW